MLEARPGNRALVHHIIAFIREPDSKWLKDAKPGVPFVPKKNKDGEKDKKAATGRRFPARRLRAGYLAVELAPGQAKLVKAGSDIVFQMHYTANGQAGNGPEQSRHSVRDRTA